MISDAKTEYMNSKILECSIHPNRLFKTIKNLLGISKNDTLPSNSSDLDLANRFSVFFVDKIHTVRESTRTLAATADPSCEPPSNVSANLTTFDPVTVDDVVQIIAKSPNTTCRLDPVPTWIVKQLVTSFAPGIRLIINSSLQTAEMPT